ncbi:MAG: tetratricopeptide repeat protein [Flavobacterium sp.]|nr:tetratricopeptide repeat protein [Flavobacterium sp.]
MKKIIFLILFTILQSNSASLWAQNAPEDVALEKDDFEDAFFESLKQKGIENYDKAIIELEKCLKIQPNNATIYFELGKNYLEEKEYKKAYESFEKATKLDSNNRWFWAGMYDVCYETKEFEKAIPIVLKLIEFKKEYKEELVSLYMNTNQFDAALELINELNDQVGKLEMRNIYKAQILEDPKYRRSERVNLLDQIKKNPKEESNYVALIFLYNKENQEELAQEIAKKLELEIPNSDWAKVSLFKLYLKNNDGENAVKAMNFVLGSLKIDQKIKHRMLNEFLLFIKDKPQFDSDLEKAVSYFDTDKSVEVAKELGKFYQNKKNWEKAIRFYEIQLKKTPDELETALLLLECYTEKGDFDVIEKKAENWLQIYPTQPQFYYYQGLALNQKGAFKKAIDVLESGLDFVIDNPQLELNFNIQLGEAYNGLGDLKKKEYYFSKAESALKNKN